MPAAHVGRFYMSVQKNTHVSVAFIEYENAHFN